MNPKLNEPKPTKKPSANTVTKTGKVRSFQLEGVTGALLDSTDGKTYRLTGQTNVSKFAGFTVTVTGRLLNPKDTKDGAGIPLPNYTLLLVESISSTDPGAPTSGSRPSWCELAGRFPGLSRLGDYREKCL